MLRGKTVCRSIEEEGCVRRSGVAANGDVVPNNLQSVDADWPSRDDMMCIERNGDRSEDVGVRLGFSMKAVAVPVAVVWTTDFTSGVSIPIL